MIALDVARDPKTDETFALDGAKFNRHTFWCGQSGSGKTYALGVVLERLLLATRLPLLILDPNADFVRFGEPRADAPEEVARAIQRADIRVFRPNATVDPLVARFVDLPLTSRAAVLRLDPIRDVEEFNVMKQLDSRFGPLDGARMVETLRHAQTPAGTRLLQRIENLEVLEWDVWAYRKEPTPDTVASRPEVSVLDLGGFARPEEPVVAALAMLDRLWAERETRTPMLIVIDEAHNLCPPDPRSPLQELLTERIIQIAAEGRKFGLWLFLSTQRPSKIHPQVLSQCDNLGIMKMSSPIDLRQLAQYFGAVPQELLDRATGFAQGQALFAGGFAPSPAVVQMQTRFTSEGGSDVPIRAR